MNVIKYKGYRVPKTPKNMAKVKRDLIVQAESEYGTGYGEPVSFPVYRHNSKSIYVPKFYGLKEFGEAQRLERLGETIRCKFKGELYSFQKDIVNDVIGKIKTDDSAILSAGCGLGKTSMAIYIIGKLKLKTLIVVHKMFLLHQWEDRIKQFMPDARVGIIRRDVVDVEDKDIIITMLQSLTTRAKPYPDSTFDSCGFLVVDESHNISTRVFSKAFFQVATKKSLGLSATPYRKDGLTKVLKWFLGDILTFENKGEKISPKVSIVKAEYSEFPAAEYNYVGKINLPAMITKVVNDPKRNLQIVNIIRKALQHDRKILLLSDRRSHCEAIRKLLGEDVSTGLYIGGMKKEALDESNTRDVILATYSMAKEGYDCAKLDTLIFATSRTDITQAVGRIMRKKNKNFPLVYDIADSTEGFKSQVVRRKRFYRKNGYTIMNDETLARKPKQKEYHFV